MKKVYLCGSFRFLNEIEDLAGKLEERTVECQMPKKNNRGILRCLKKIDDSDIVYIVNPEGYVGKSVSVDIGYAYAKNKRIYAMCPVNDPPVENLIKGIMMPDALIDLFRADPPDRKG